MRVQGAARFPGSNHLQTDLLYRVDRLEPFRTDLGAIHDRAAAKQPIGAAQVVETLLGGAIAPVDDEAIGLDQTGGADEPVGVQPVRWALAAAACAENALVRAVQPFTLGRRLKPFLFRRQLGVDEVGLDRVILFGRPAAAPTSSAHRPHACWPARVTPRHNSAGV